MTTDSSENKPTCSAAVHEPLPVTAAGLATGLDETVHRFVLASDQNLGHLEVQVQQQAQELLRQATEKGAQQKADQTPPVCSVCGLTLSRVSHGHARTFETRFGSVIVRRTPRLLPTLPQVAFSG